MRSSDKRTLDLKLFKRLNHLCNFTPAQKRMFCATLALQMGYGGLTAISKEMNISPNTIRHGMSDLGVLPGSGSTPVDSQTAKVNAAIDTALHSMARSQSDFYDLEQSHDTDADDELAALGASAKTIAEAAVVSDKLVASEGNAESSVSQDDLVAKADLNVDTAPVSTEATSVPKTQDLSLSFTFNQDAARPLGSSLDYFTASSAEGEIPTANASATLSDASALNNAATQEVGDVTESAVAQAAVADANASAIATSAASSVEVSAKSDDDKPGLFDQLFAMHSFGSQKNEVKSQAATATKSALAKPEAESSASTVAAAAVSTILPQATASSESSDSTTSSMAAPSSATPTASVSSTAQATLAAPTIASILSSSASTSSSVAEGQRTRPSFLVRINRIPEKVNLDDEDLAPVVTPKPAQSQVQAVQPAEAAKMSVTEVETDSSDSEAEDGDDVFEDVEAITSGSLGYLKRTQ